MIPTAGKLTVLFLLEDLYKSLRSLKEAFARKGVEFDSILKMGRTQLQDAVPIRLGQEFKAYATALDRGLRRIRSAAAEMTSINMGVPPSVRESTPPRPIPGILQKIFPG